MHLSKLASSSGQPARVLRACVLSLAVCCVSVHPALTQTLAATTPAATTLSLADAEAAALKSQPRMLAAQLRARSSAQRITQARSALLPTVAFNATGVRVADTGSSTAVGNITTSAISDRFAYGGNLSQLVTDFGRTSALVGSARSQAEAQADIATLTRAQVRLNVRAAYYSVLGAEAVLRAAQAALDNRTLIARQLGALAQSELRSTLDVNFASVLESQAQLAVVRAQSLVAQQRARLATAMGTTQQIAASLEQVAPGDASLPAAPEDLVASTSAQRADLSAARAQEHAAQQFASAEKRLSYPTLNVLAAAGDVPFHDHTLHDNYAAAGFNLNIPIFNGGLFAARRNEANLEASARARDLQAVQLEVNEQVRSAWYRADEAFRAIAVTDKLVVQSREALRLAQARYDAGLSGIVELNEAQLNEISAEITAADANYSYLTQRAQLDFAAGLLN
jgi:outer membrane protein